MVEDVVGVIFWTDNVEEMAGFYEQALDPPSIRAIWILYGNLLQLFPLLRTADTSA